jgi:histidine triad (HIT) family protein
MQDSVFTKIIKGELPSYKVYEDAKTVVIIPLYPIAKAHVLAIPKAQVDEFYKLSNEDYQALFATVKIVSERMANVVDSKRVGLQIVGLDESHAHVHIVAFDTLKEFQESPDESLPPDNAKREALATQLRMESKDV